MCRLSLAATFLLSSGLAAMAQAPDNYTKLPPGPGRDVETHVCSMCHSPELPATQHHDRAGWTDLVNQMRANGASASEADFAKIIDYLTASFPGKK